MFNRVLFLTVLFSISRRLGSLSAYFESWNTCAVQEPRAGSSTGSPIPAPSNCSWRDKPFFALTSINCDVFARHTIEHMCLIPGRGNGLDEVKTVSSTAVPGQIPWE